MAFSPGLKTENLGVNVDYAFLASEHMMTIRSGVTIDAATVGAIANGDKILEAGTVLGKITTGGKYAAYDDALSDGREVAVGFLMEEINVKDGDVIVTLLTHGSIMEARVSGLDAAAKTDLGDRFFYFA